MWIRTASILGFYLCSVGFAHAASLSLLPAAGVIDNGREFDVDVVLTSEEAITAAEATLSFNPAALEVVSVDTLSSILSLWPTQPLYSNDRGTIQFSGSANAPWSGSGGVVVKIRFKARGVGVQEVWFDDGVALATTGSNTITTMSSGMYRVEATSVEPETSSEPLEVARPAQGSAEPIPIPLIEKTGTDLELGERLIVRGLVIPDVLVHLDVEFAGEKQTFRVPSAGDGSFTFVSDFRAEEGVYRVTARAEGRGVIGPSSETVSYTVRALGLTAAAGTAVEVMTYVIPLLAMTALLGFIVAFAFRRRT